MVVDGLTKAETNLVFQHSIDYYNVSNDTPAIKDKYNWGCVVAAMNNPLEACDSFHGIFEILTTMLYAHDSKIYSQ